MGMWSDLAIHGMIAYAREARVKFRNNDMCEQLHNPCMVFLLG